MFSFSPRTFSLGQILGGIFIFLALLPASAALSRSFSSVTLLHEYLLDSDGVDGDDTTNRHTAETTFEAEVSIQAGDPTHFATYRVAYRLEDSSGVAVDLVNGDPLHPTEPNKWAYTNTATALILSSSPGSRTLVFNAVPDPVDTLDSKTPYRVEGFLQIRTATNPEVWENVTFPFGPFTLNVRTQTPDTQFLHFTNTVSGDPEYNVRAGISSLAWDRVHALATDEAEDSFTAEVEVFANRWDDFESSAFFNTINFFADFDLIEVGSGTNIPLENDGITEFSIFEATHTFSLTPNPTLRTTTIVAGDLKPLQQLSSASETYILRCTIRHEEDAIGTIYEDTVCDLAAKQLLHFNGNLAFGPIDTTFDQLGNDPSVLAGSGPTFVNTQIQVPADQGNIPNRPSYGFGDNLPLSVQLLNNGNSIIQAGSSQTVYVPGNPGATLSCDYGGIEVQYGDVILSSTGANSTSLRVNFPQGLTLIEDEQQNAFLGENHLTLAAGAPLDEDLCPIDNPEFTFGPRARVADESHPVTFEATSVKVERGLFRFNAGDPDYIHDEAFARLKFLSENGTIQASFAQRRSNDRYLKDVVQSANELQINLGEDGTSRLNTQVELAPGSFQPHFPTRSALNFQAASTLEWQEGEVANGLVLDQVNFVQLAYYQTCPGDDCTASLSPVTVTQTPDSQQLFLVPGGGLHGAGNLVVNEALIWGVREPGQYAHRTAEFDRTSFYMPGYQLYSKTNVLVPDGPLQPGDADLAPSLLLLSGFNRDLASPDLHFSTELGYTQGDGDLAGFSGPADQGGLQSDGPDRYYFRIQTSESDLDANFFRISISLN